jgi:NADPH:quinone reductase-like Zn-dependent oxidoreductase
MMKAISFNRFGGREVLEIVDLPDPHPGPSEAWSTTNAHA